MLQSSEGLLAVSALSYQYTFFLSHETSMQTCIFSSYYTQYGTIRHNIFSARWTKNYYHESHRVFSSDSVQNIGIPVQVSDIQRTSSRILSQHEKYRKAFGIAQKLASLASEIPMNGMPAKNC